MLEHETPLDPELRRIQAEERQMSWGVAGESLGSRQMSWEFLLEETDLDVPRNSV